MDFNTFLNNEYLIATLLLFFIIYSYAISVKIPSWVSSLFKNDIFRVLYLSLLLIVPFETSPYVALIIALVFVVTMNIIGKEEKKELFTKINKTSKKIKGGIKKRNPIKINSKRNTKINSKRNTKRNTKNNTKKRNTKRNKNTKQIENTTRQISKRLSKM